MNAGPHPSAPNQGHSHHLGRHHGSIRTMGAGRYPMSSRSVVVHSLRPIPRDPLPARQYNAVPHLTAASVPHPPQGPMPGGQPLRSMSNGSSPLEQSHNNGHPHLGAKHTNALNRTGQTPMHHPVPYRRIHPIAGSNAPRGYEYHQLPQRGAFPMVHQHIGQRPDVRFIQAQHVQSAKQPSSETSIDHKAVSRSPSPPPAPPEPGKSPPKQTPSIKVERVVSVETVDNNPLSERSNLQEVKTKPSKEDATADAASILLQLSSRIKGTKSMEKPTDVVDNRSQENAPQSQGIARTSIVPSANLLKPIVESPSGDDSTRAPSAPELASEPSSDSIETESEFPAPIPENFPRRLALPYDDSKLNSLHCFLRSELLEIFVVQKSMNKSPTHSPGSSVGRVGLRCVHCALNRKKRDDRDEAPMAVFYPKSIAEIYRLVTSWQRCHLRKCRNLPPAVRSQWQSLRENDKSRGKTHYWITSAKEIGLIDCQSRAGGIRFGPNVNKNVAPSSPKGGAITADTTASSDVTNVEVPTETMTSI